MLEQCVNRATLDCNALGVPSGVTAWHAVFSATDWAAYCVELIHELGRAIWDLAQG